jgi:hypothetical protein
MRKAFLWTALFAVLTLCLSGTASATLINQWHDGDRVVYDTVNDMYWYPFIDEFTDMNRRDQRDAIRDLDHASSTRWKMATWKQTSLLKLSLAEMAKTVVPTAFGPGFGAPDPNPQDRGIDSPWVAFNVNSGAFFTPTGQFNMGMVVPWLDPEDPMAMADVFNGRTTGWGMTNIGTSPPGFFGEVVWSKRNADDHWVSHSILNDGDAKLTMTYNFDQHYLPDWATQNALMGDVGAWAVTKYVPEPATMMILGFGLIGLAAVSRKFKKD